ncbi:hypothetical protein DRJ17_04520 [Candidatus Woesearchaeota archaeon]|nr:MAG: hypothetical protein DRJ17_04520 [Candidatus Woesearchaeota archaeon]
MIIAIPCYYYQIKYVKELGFLTFPEFVDNEFVRFGKPNVKKLLKILVEYGNEVKFVVYPDFRYDLLWLLKKFSHINWIFPLHFKSELNFAQNFEWVAFPRKPCLKGLVTRDYSLNEFLEFTKDKKRWFLGWMGKKPEIILNFDGFDTTIPSFFVKNGLIWQGWKKHTRPINKLTNEELFKINLLNFKNAIIELTNQSQLRRFL